MKEFKYDILISEDDVCNRKQEMATLLKAAQKNKRIVLLAPRRYGKTSLIKNVISSKVRETQPKKLIIFVDLMEVESLSSIAERIEYGVTKALAKSPNITNLIKIIANVFKNIALQIDVDALTGLPSLVFKKNSANDKKNLAAILDGICSLAEKQPIVLILDEFQDIAFIPEAQGIFRATLQQITNSAIFILGSKRHIMEEMLNKNTAPLFHFGDEMHLGPIAEEEWLPYFAERLEPKKVSLNREALHYLCERMCQVPNAICEIGAWIQEQYYNKQLNTNDIEQTLNNMVECKQSYAYRLQNFSGKEKIFLQAIAKLNFVTQPHSLEFLKTVNIPKSSVGKLLKKFTDHGIIEMELTKGWRLSDPVFAHYLRRTII